MLASAPAQVSEECFLEPECGEECRTVTDRKCAIVEEMQCGLVQEQQCDTEQEEQCSTVTEQQCSPRTEKKCETGGYLNVNISSKIVSSKYLRIFG